MPVSFRGDNCCDLVVKSAVWLTYCNRRGASVGQILLMNSDRQPTPKEMLLSLQSTVARRVGLFVLEKCLLSPRQVVNYPLIE